VEYLNSASPRFRQRGFTLIELAVIVLIVTIIIAAIGINLTRSDRDRVRDEAERLAVLIQAARDEAVLQGRVLVMELTDDGYRFLMTGSSPSLAQATCFHRGRCRSPLRHLLTWKPLTPRAR